MGGRWGASEGLLARKHPRCCRTPLSGCACVTATQACSSKAAALSISDTSHGVMSAPGHTRSGCFRHGRHPRKPEPKESDGNVNVFSF